MAIRSSVSSVVVLTMTVVACSSDDSGSGYPTTQVKDQAGRSCTIGEAQSATCDQEPKPTTACKPSAKACFTLGTSGDAAGPGAICAACCEGNTTTSVRADCSPLTCSTDTDCPSPYGRCANGQCRH